MLELKNLKFSIGEIYNQRFEFKYKTWRGTCYYGPEWIWKKYFG